MRDPASLDPLFRPRSVAIVGASSDANKIGGRPLAFLRQAGFAGALYPINPGAAEVQGLRAYASLEGVDADIDQAIIAVPPQHAVAAMRACAAKGVKAAQVFAAGFAEAGEAGARLQSEMLGIARDARIRVLGPNSLGLFNVREKFFGTFATALDGAWPKAGGVSFATQSGAFGSYCYALAEQRGLGFAHFAATGNEGDVDVADVIEWLAHDEHTHVIVATFEGCRDGRRLMAALEAARAARKPVVVMKAGASEAGAAAAATHTGSLAGADAVYDGVFRQCNAWRARSLDELVDIAYAASRAPLPRGHRLGAVTTSGGIGVLVADAAVESGMTMPPLSSEGAARVKAILPFAGAANPLDTSAALIGDLSLFAKSLEILLENAQCDAVLGYLAHVGRNPRHYGQLRDPLFALKGRYPETPFVVSMLCPPDVRADIEGEGMLVFEEPTRAVRALAALASVRAGFDRPAETAVVEDGQATTLHSGPLNEAASKRIVAAAGVPVLDERVAQSASEAVEAARKANGPVALKIVSPDVPHKSDVGGVMLGVAVSDAASAFETIVANVKRAVPAARIDGVLVSPMVSGGVETILGVVDDPVFGPVVMFGSGGVLVEVLKDVVFRAAPFDAAVAREMVAATTAARLLDGVRGAPRADREALVDALVGLSRFAWRERRTVASIDINPFVVLERGAVALDALVVGHKEQRT